MSHYNFEFANFVQPIFTVESLYTQIICRAISVGMFFVTYIKI